MITERQAGGTKVLSFVTNSAKFIVCVVICDALLFIIQLVNHDHQKITSMGLRHRFL
jgi:hypothetical protein